MSAVPRSLVVPNANSPQLLTRLLEVVARGVRSTRGLQESLGVDGRTVQYYVQAAEWLGLLRADESTWLTPLGLEFVYAGRSRPEIYARAVWGTPFVAELMSDRSAEIPPLEAIVEAVRKLGPDLAEATIQRRAVAIRSLIAPALGREPPKPSPLQLTLPMAAGVHKTVLPQLSLDSGRDYNPDVYRYLLCALLDHGELSLGQIRALLDKATVSEAPIGGYIDLALARGDARRLGERLVVTPAAIDARELVETTPSIILSDPEYRSWLADLLGEASDPRAVVRRRQAGARFRHWDRRLFGREAAPETLSADMDRVLMDRSLASFPRRGEPGAELVPVLEPFLDVWQRSGIAVALPPSLVHLTGGLEQVNAALRAARQGPATVALPGLAHRPVLFHGGLLHPGEILPRSVPDMRTLRQRLLLHAPYPSMFAALLLLHRQDPGTIEVSAERGRWQIRVHGQRVGEVLELLDDFCLSREWVATRRPQAGFDAAQVLDVLQQVGIASVIGTRATLSEGFFSQLRTEAEEIEVRERLQGLAEALADHLHAGGSADEAL